MFISYFDDSGDDGYPKFSTEIFVLTSLYFHESVWKENFTKLYELRKYINNKYGMPIKEEVHTKEFITDKDPYHGLYTNDIRKSILFDFVKASAMLNMKVISVAIDKTKISRPSYDVLEKALTYNVQRIENDLNYLSSDSKFIIITDEGRVSKMRSTTRAIQKINFIPSMYNSNSYRQEIKNLIEDPLPKPSNQSYFIQLADMICFITSLYIKNKVCNPRIEWGKRVKNVLNYGDDLLLLEILKPIINLKASRLDQFGVVCYPK